MKLICVTLSFTVLLTGCYSHTTVTAGSPKSECEVEFQLKDGAYVRSKDYERVKNGYRVVGTKVEVQEQERRRFPKGTAFSGILFDTQIEEVFTSEFDTAWTVVSVVLVVGAVVGIAFLIEKSIERSYSLDFSSSK